MPSPHLPRWLTGEQAESLTRMKWAFLLMAGLSIYSMVGQGAEYAKAPLSGIAWMIGIAIFGFFAVAASRREGVRVVAQYMQGMHGVRRVLVFTVLLWATVIASAHVTRIVVDMIRDNTVSDYSYQFGVAGTPTTVFIVATVILFFVVSVLGRSALSTPEGVTRQHMRGSNFASRESYLAELEKRYPERPPAPEIAGVPFPPGHERMHTAIAASTGAGKTTALRGLLETIRARGDRAIVLDNNSEFMRAFRQDGDFILSPFHEETVGWRLSNEARDLYDWDRLASGFVPEGNGNSAEWHDMAKSLFGAVGAGLFEVYDGKFTNAELQRVLIAAEAEELAPLVSGTTAEVLAASDDYNARRLQSVRMSFIANLKAWRYVKDGDFSLRDWIASDTSEWMFLPYSDYEMTLARDLLAAWVDIMVTSALNRREGPAPLRTTWIIVDELNSLGEIPALLVGATRLRKAGVAIVVAVQDFAQLRETYSDNRAETLMNNFSNKLVLRTTEGNAAEYLSKQLGDREMQEDHTSFGTGGGGSLTYSTNIVMERLVLPSEIQKLPDLEGYLNFAGDWPIIKVRVPLPQ
ncbi:type IV secretion system DNA-binding domain-containing protein [Agrobacterium rubi]|uniref:Type IV secretion system DNA-binding domain-containing protein n=2 Tax=Agrobacterium rubi TaxID=28099 RepID=A0AAE7RCL8_9HYPH|nr:type IV secretion system DNA-binding domain-containing protein [Agrobacterium rubi]NTE90098.1 type IV secretion system DNA-binding domain-containing protein [Agrobacterium rubi]NTF39432.1 type IV secretion system DNA-binding domain-containing protein [Agrobacterium rubi]QTG03902.1 type IV secretion system DNA-binding domain-containing protein [Agrobacterium rubi]